MPTSWKDTCWWVALPPRILPRQVDDSESVSVKAEAARFVGRGGEKLDGAIGAFNLDLTGLRVLDAGASTGGFTDCALQAGAVEVVALDVGHGLIHDKLRRDPRVTLMERRGTSGCSTHRRWIRSTQSCRTCRSSR